MIVIFFLIILLTSSQITIEYNEDEETLQINGSGKIADDFYFEIVNELKTNQNFTYEDLSQIKSIEINQKENQIEWKSYSFFQQFASLQNVSININHLPNYLFLHSSITSIVVGKDVESIGEYCFSDCQYLQKIVFDNDCKIKHIGNYAFDGCNQLESIVLPKSIDNIDFRKVFENCFLLKRIDIEEGGKYSSDGTIVYSNNHTVVEYCHSLNEIRNYEMNEQVEIISKNVFSDSSFETVSFPLNLKEIHEKAFYGDNNKYETLFIPINVDLIKSFAFAFNSNVKNVVITSRNITIEENAFYGCYNLKNFIFVGEELNIESNPFEKCLQLEHIKASESFEDDSEIEGIDIDDSSILYKSCGDNCLFIIDKNNTNNIYIFGNGTLTQFDDEITSYIVEIENINIEEGIISIETKVFQNFINANNQ